MEIDRSLPDDSIHVQDLSSAMRSRFAPGGQAFVPPRVLTASSPQQDSTAQAHHASSAAAPALLGMAGQGSRRGVGGNQVVGTKLTRRDYALIVDYLEVQDNYNAIFGAGRKTRPGNRYQSKKSVFTSMAAVLADYGFPKMDGANLAKRFGRYQDMYKKALMFKTSSGGGLTEEEVQCGVTMDQKLDKMCPLFDRMHAICGERANIQPPGLVSHGFAGSGITQAPDEAEEAADESENEVPDPEEEPTSPTWLMADSPPGVEDESVNPGGESQPPTPNATEAEAAPSGTEEVRPTNMGGMPQQVNDGPSRTQPTVFSGSRPAHTGIPSSPNVQTTQAPTRSQSTSRANEKSAPPKKKPGFEGSATSKGSLAAMYAEQKREKAGFRKELIGTKTLWKKDELDDRRKARVDAAKNDKLERVHKFRLEQFSATQAEKRLRMDQTHQMLMAQMTMRGQLMSDLFKSNKSEAEISRLMKMVETTYSMPTNSGPPLSDENE